MKRKLSNKEKVMNMMAFIREVKHKCSTYAMLESRDRRGSVFSVRDAGDKYRISHDLRVTDLEWLFTESYKSMTAEDVFNKCQELVDVSQTRRQERSSRSIRMDHKKREVVDMMSEIEALTARIEELKAKIEDKLTNEN